MRIGILARGLSEKSGGPKQYIESMISALLKFDAKNQYIIFYDKFNHLGKFPQATERVLNIPTKLLWDYIGVPPAARREKLDLLVCPKNVVPYFVPCRSVIVIHDLAYFIEELDEYKFWDTLYMRRMMPSSSRRANAIIAISENTKNDIIRFIGVSAEKISVIYEAPDKKYRIIEDHQEKERVIRRYALKIPFIFYSGSLSPRKNISSLLESFARIKDRIPHYLVFTAGKSWKDSPVFKKIQELEVEDRIIVAGHVKDEDMPLLYNLAGLFVYPSLYEGFGLPPLEAMACGCPVITSNTSSLPEVVSNAAIMVDPYNFEQLAGKMYEVLTNDFLKKELIEKGIKRVELFSWEKVAGKMVELFEDLKSQ